MDRELAVLEIGIYDVGLVVNPLVGEADMHGSLVQSFQMRTDAIPPFLSDSHDNECPRSADTSVHRQLRTPLVLRDEKLQ